MAFLDLLVSPCLFCLPMHGALRRHLSAFVRSRTYCVRSLAHLVGSLNRWCLVGMRLQIHFVSRRQTPHSFGHVPAVRSFTRFTAFLDLLVSPCLVLHAATDPLRSSSSVPFVRSVTYQRYAPSLTSRPSLIYSCFLAYYQLASFASHRYKSFVACLALRVTSSVVKDQ